MGLKRWLQSSALEKQQTERKNRLVHISDGIPLEEIVRSRLILETFNGRGEVVFFAPTLEVLRANERPGEEWVYLIGKFSED